MAKSSIEERIKKLQSQKEKLDKRAVARKQIEDARKILKNLK